MRRFPALSLDHVWLIVVLTVTLVLVNGQPVDQTDYWWNVRLGEDLWATHQLPTTNTLTFTPTREPYIEQQWLSQLLLAAVHDRWGLEGWLLLRALLVAITVALVFRVCRWAGASGAVAGLITIASLLLIVPGAAVRPQLPALPLFALFLAGSTVWQGRGWTLVALPLAMALWANLHGSYPMGLVLVGTALAGEIWRYRAAPANLTRGLPRRLALLLALCGLAVLVNPYTLRIGPWVVAYLSLLMGGQEGAFLGAEWVPTSMGQREGTYFFASVLLLVLVLVRVGPPPPADALRLVLFGVLGLTTIRSTTWWGFVWAPGFAWGISQWLTAGAAPAAGPAPGGRPGGRPRGVPLVNAALALGCALIAVWSVPMVRAAFGEPLSIADPTQPYGAAEYLAGRGGGLRVFNDMSWGGYLGWRLVPANRIFIDDRHGVYPADLFRDYFRASDARPGWEDVLTHYAVDGLVLSRQREPDLMQALATTPAWPLVYCDGHAAVYLRRDLAGSESATCPMVESR